MPAYFIRQRSVTSSCGWRQAAGGVIRAHWTNEIHNEWMRNVEKDFGVARNILERVRKLMDREADDALIMNYRKHERLFPNTNVKDRHVAAAAVAALKQSGAITVVIVTWNLKDFDRDELTAVGAVAESPDTFLCRLLADSPAHVIAAFMRMRENLRRPTKTFQECADTLAAQGVKRFARLLLGMVK